MLMQKNRLFIVCMLCSLSPFTFVSFGREAKQEYSATTISDPQIPVEDLELLLKPLTKSELIVEAEAWLQLLKVKVTEISAVEIQMRRKSREIDEKQAQIEQTSEETETTQEQMLVNINRLREQRTALIDRFNVVVTSLKNKGGEVDEYEKYAAAVSGLSLDIQKIKDVSAFRTIVWGWLISPEGGLRRLKNIVFFLITLLVFYCLANAAGRIIHKTISASKKFSDLLKEFFVNATRKTVMLIGLIVALSMLEVQIAPFIAGLGVAGFILGFALQGTLSNFASGLMILIYRPFDVGQIIEAAGVMGIVDSMNLVSTTIKTLDNQVVVVPNGEIWGGVITNITGSDTRRVDMVFGISYSDDISKTAKVLDDIVSKHELILKDPEPVIKVHELADSSVNFVCRPWVKTDDYWNVYWDVTRAVKERFDAEGISIPFPQQDVHLHKTGGG